MSAMAAVGRSVLAVEAQLYKKLRMPRVPARRADMPLIDWTLGSLVNAGRRVEEIAVEFGTTYGSISTAISRYNVESSATFRPCMCCRRNFFRKHDRLCSHCSTGELACVA
jgi:hypothetical protein